MKKDLKTFTALFLALGLGEAYAEEAQPAQAPLPSEKAAKDETGSVPLWADPSLVDLNKVASQKKLVQDFLLDVRMNPSIAGGFNQQNEYRQTDTTDSFKQYSQVLDRPKVEGLLENPNTDWKKLKLEVPKPLTEGGVKELRFQR